MDEDVPRNEKGYREIYKNLDVGREYDVVRPANVIPELRVTHTKKRVPKFVYSAQWARNLNDVEYDMDALDARFLETMKSPEIEGSVFELIIDRLEKEWLGFLKKGLVGRAQGPRETEQFCDVCTRDKSEDRNSLIFCEGCGLCVHQDCYGVPYVSNSFWVCRKCLCVGRDVPHCEFCAQVGGAYKQRQDLKWGHVVCVLYIENLCFLNDVFLEPIECLPFEKLAEKCAVCSEEHGMLIKCSLLECTKKYHVTCGMAQGYYYDHANLLSYCHVHDPTLETIFWSIEDFYGFRSLSYKKLSKRPEIRRRVGLHTPQASRLLDARESQAVCHESFVDRIRVLDVAPKNLPNAEEVLELVCAYWIAKRRLVAAPLLRGFDVLTCDVDILSWVETRDCAADTRKH